MFKLFKRHTTVMFVHLRSEGVEHDRFKRIKGRKASISEFFDWIREEQETIKNDIGKPAVVTNCNLFVE